MKLVVILVILCGAFAYDVVDKSTLTVISTAYDTSYQPFALIENIELVNGTKISSNALRQSVVNPTFRSNLMYFVKNSPKMNSFEEISLYYNDRPVDNSFLLSQEFCNTISVTYMSENVNNWFVLAGEKQACGNQTCLTCSHVFQIDSFNGHVTHLFASPLNSFISRPLSWMTYNEDAKLFIFFVPDSTSDYRLSRFVTRSISGDEVYSNRTDMLFYSIDWLNENTVIGPCVDSSKNFGLCAADYLTGETLQVIRLLPSYNPRLTATRFDANKEIFVFSSQPDVTRPELIRIYFARVKDSYDIVHSLPYTLPNSYILQGLFTSDQLVSNELQSSTSTIVEGSTKEASSYYSTKTILLCTLIFAGVMVFVLSLLLVFVFIWQRRKKNRNSVM